MARVLVVDDDQVYRNIVFQTLRKAGYEVESVADAFDAMEAVQWRDFDVIVLDLRMAVFNGERLIDYLQRLMPDVLQKVIVITGVPDAKRLLKDVPLSAVYEKPVHQRDLLEAVEKVAKSGKKKSNGK